MAISRIKKEYKKENGNSAIDISVENGDLDALRAVVSKWEFKDEESALRFAIAILTKADKGTLSISGETVFPTNQLLKDKDDASKQ
ncbi:MAG: hypothetical protein LBL84_01760 [Candidatus Nomurabacteria bacterium]|jgi:hypothetical protein|nr:hypothetical protein [Candidatus Nomurabacteria bacterium]